MLLKEAQKLQTTLLKWLCNGKKKDRYFYQEIDNYIYIGNGYTVHRVFKPMWFLDLNAMETINMKKVLETSETLYDATLTNEIKALEKGTVRAFKLNDKNETKVWINEKYLKEYGIENLAELHAKGSSNISPIRFYTDSEEVEMLVLPVRMAE